MAGMIGGRRVVAVVPSVDFDSDVVNVAAHRCAGAALTLQLLHPICADAPGDIT
jgi:hypothetical protein